MYKIEFKAGVKKDLDKIPQKDLIRIRESIINLGNNPLPVGVRKIRKVKESSFRFREGDFRIIYLVEFSYKRITIISVKRRNEQTYK